MLTQLKVSDFALIENIEVQFHRGLNVLTGETGAGKTVLIGAIGLLLGDRADSTMVRHGAKEASFNAVFDLEGSPAAGELVRAGFLSEGESELSLGRTVTADGKSRCDINGRLCPVSALSEIGDILIEVHGQNTHQALLRVGTHLEYLDRFAGSSHLEKLGAYRERYSRLRSLLDEKRELAGGGLDLEREADIIGHEIEAIDEASPEAGELEALEAEAGRLRHSRELWELAMSVEAALSGGERSRAAVMELLTGAAADVRKMAARDTSLEETAGRLESLAYDVEDIVAVVARYAGSLDTDPAALQDTEARLSLLRELCRRFGGTLDEVLDYREKAAARLADIEGVRGRLEAVDGEISAEKKAATGLARELSAGREKAAGALEKAVTKQLKQLELGGARFKVSVGEREAGGGDPDTGHLGQSGTSEVEFLFTSEASQPVRPLRRIASGGEMSRVMLALKIVLAGADRLPVLVFDEVDAGIGGETAWTVGEKLFQLTGHHQVFCVTHIPQIATFADWQYRVFKSGEGAGTRTFVELLEEKRRVDEVCRMLGDSSGRKVTREHASDLIRRAGEAKSRVPQRRGD